ncbi:MAG: hypothetical protein ABL963_07645 [Longimicrobiales bacterium]
MTPNQRARLARSGRPSGPRLAVALLAAVALPACAGENLFTGLVTSDQGPQVEINTPTAGAAVAANDSVLVTASITATRGISAVQFSGVLDAGGGAFINYVFTSAGTVSDTTLTTYMRRSGVTTGGAKIIVEATDALGDKGADTVAVVLN